MLRSRVAAVALSLMGLPGFAAAATVWQNTGNKVFPLKSSIATAPVSAAQVLHVAVNLKVQNPAALRAFLAAQHTPGSPAYGVRLTPAQFAAAYSPSASAAQSVADYLAATGFKNVQIAPNRLLITADASAAVAQAAFNTRLVQFPLQGRNVFLYNQPVQVPAALADTVLSVFGLQSLSTIKPALLKPTRNATGIPALNFEFNGPQFQTAYHAGSTPSGSTTTLAIITAGSDLQSVIADLRQYETQFGLPQVPVTVTQVAPLPSPQDTSGNGEWDLDSQSATGIAGSVKQLIFYNTTDLSDAALQSAYNRFVTDDAAQVGNMSFGGCELLSGALGLNDASDQAFMQAVAQGQTLFASSGDAGAACSVLINLGLPDSGVPDVEYPASSPYVVAVGGTTLLTNDDFSYNTEVSWTGGGGGTSLFEAAPSWQQGVVPASAVLETLRGVPDVAMDADPNTGATVISNGSATVIGGTSLASPLAAGVWARLQSAHCNQLGFAAPLIYALDSSRAPLTAAKGFNDVLLGSNGLWAATPGWDYTTGFGSFDIAAVNAALPKTAGCTP